jgi:hypothetical protein
MNDNRTHVDNLKDFGVGLGKTLGELGLAAVYGVGKLGSAIGEAGVGDPRLANWITQQASANWDRLDQVTRPYTQSWAGKAGYGAGWLLPASKGAAAIRLLKGGAKQKAKRKVATAVAKPKPKATATKMPKPKATKKPKATPKFKPHPSVEDLPGYKPVPYPTRNQEYWRVHLDLKKKGIID